MLADPVSLLPALGGWVLAAVACHGLHRVRSPVPLLARGFADLHRRPAACPAGPRPAPCSSASSSPPRPWATKPGTGSGRRFGPRLFRPGARVLKTDYLHRAEAFFDRHGGKALVLARFVPIVRTFVPLAAGAAGYTYRKFLLWNIAGALLWGGGMTLAGSMLGQVPFVAGHVDLLAILIVAVSLLPVGAALLPRHRRAGGSGPAGQDQVQEPTAGT